MTKKEQRIVDSPAYAELVLKLGVSASGNEARNDSDSHANEAQIPTTRLRRALFLDQNDDEASHGLQDATG